MAETFVDCSIAEGAAFAISAVLFYLLSSIGMFLVSHPTQPLIRFEGWTGGRVGGCKTNNSKVAHTAVIVHQEEHNALHVSSTSPPMDPCFPSANLLHAGASVSPGWAEDEKSDT